MSQSLEAKAEAITQSIWPYLQAAVRVCLGLAVVVLIIVDNTKGAIALLGVLATLISLDVLAIRYNKNKA